MTIQLHIIEKKNELFLPISFYQSRMILTKKDLANTSGM